jgi:hypothetical protein
VPEVTVCRLSPAAKVTYDTYMEKTLPILPVFAAAALAPAPAAAAFVYVPVNQALFTQEQPPTPTVAPRPHQWEQQDTVTCIVIALIALAGIVYVKIIDR